ncbi:MAG TPA: class I poly(R)-hydroxyalkanoic acid synthase [Burkholderiales bacterium]|nr:class I poly(R)-hydroxyalkanoic acid synthase [Burkholderiales bacterium]
MNQPRNATMGDQSQQVELKFDPAEVARLYADIAARSGELLGKFMERQAEGQVRPMGDELGISKAFFEAWARMLTDPLRLAETGMKIWQDYVTLWQGSFMRMLGQQPAPVAEPARGDRRFKDEAWQNNFLYDYIKQSYLIAAKHLHSTLAGVQGLDEQTAKKVDFYTRQYIDALSPTNFVGTNPEVMRETLASGGQNLVRGFANLLEDLSRGNGERLKLRMTDEEAFKVGGNIATTQGKVVFQNDLMQLIQYSPTTETVYKRPLLIVPPWINKYYILDLREKNSFVKWAVGEGHTVLIVSWVNPDARFAGKTFENYLNEGPLAALDAIGRATGEDEIDIVGFCLGGTLVATTLGYLAAQADKRVKSATFFATLIDFTRPGELEVFVDEEQVASLEKKMEERGYLEGSEMATTFNMLRANDLIWSFVVNNYLLGRDPFPFDLLYWNSDSTRMPAAMHSFYLRNMYLENKLARGGIVMNETPIDMKAVDVPTYFISTVEDHIAPWKSTYIGARLFRGSVRFVLGGSGHIAGIINPPAANKYGYWTNDGSLPEDPEAWLAGACQQPGSWWTDWSRWIASHAGPKVPARVPGDHELPVLEDAPGSYVTLRADAPGASCLPLAVAAEPGPVAAKPDGGEAPAPRQRRQRRPDAAEKPAAKAVKTALRAPRAKSKKA